MHGRFKDLVKEGLTEEELSHLKTAFDAIGDIAILEIDDALRKKEKFIAECLLKSQKNINVVVRKDSAHEGEFRTQNYKHLAGEKRKETMHIESKARLKMDVEKTYFSPRMSHERLRIASQVHEGEKVLVMFSGAGPYPIVLAKNTKAKHIVGVEINPDAHKYALESARLNKLKNVFLFNGDVKQVIPTFYSRKIGMKTHHTQLESRTKHNPPVLELHMFPDDLDKNRLELEAAIKKLPMEVVLHAPFTWNSGPLSFAAKDKKIIENTAKIVEQMGDICKKHKLRYVMHVDQWVKDKPHEFSLRALEKNLTRLRDDYMMIENPPHAEYQPEYVAGLAKKNKVGLCIDIAHLYLTRKDDESFYCQLQELSELNPYFHIADANLYRFTHDKPHSLPIGEGDIDFSRVVPYVNHGIIEVYSKDESKGTEMVRSYKKYQKMLKEFFDFDRILMPLPKSAEDFLDTALSVAKKGTIIHFYDFLHEDDFDQAREKVAKACRKAKLKYKELGLFKCGQHSPRTFRICLDFRIL